MIKMQRAILAVIATAIISSFVSLINPFLPDFRMTEVQIIGGLVGVLLLLTLKERVPSDQNPDSIPDRGR